MKILMFIPLLMLFGCSFCVDGNGKVVTNEEYVELTSFESYLNLHHTPQSFTLETPLQWPLEMRVAAHIAALEEALALLA